jgi:cytochrome P450
MAARTNGRPLPHPKDYPILGSVPAFIRDTPKTFVDGWREVGDVVLFRGLRTMTMVAHPDHVQHVLQDHSDNYPRTGRVVEKLSVLLGESIFTGEGETWRRAARTVHPLLRGDRMAEFGPAITDATLEVAGRWDGAASAGDQIDLVDEMTRLGIDAAARILFGPDRGGDFDALTKAAIVANEYAIVGVMQVGGPPDAPIRPAYRRYKAAIAHLDGVVGRAIDERRQRPGGDLLTALVQARDPETGAELTDRQVRDEAVTFLHTVYSGMPSALIWSWYVLATNPAVAERLHDELPEAAGGEPPTAEAVDRLPYLDLMLKEVLRLYPSLWIFARGALEEDQIGGYAIPAGMSIVVSPWITHRHPEFWPNPEEFDPERFTPESARGRHPFAYFPWAGGPRGCPAADFATTFAKLALVTLAQRYRVELVRGHEIQRVREHVLRPSNGLPVTVTRLRDHAADGAEPDAPRAAQVHSASPTDVG